MIRWTVPKATMVGIGLLVLAQLLYVGVLLKIEYHEFLRLILLGAPGFAAFAAAYLAPCRKLLVGISMALYGAIVAMLSAYIYEQFGLHVDRIGGLSATFVILLAYYAALSVVGGAVAVFLSRRSSDKGLGSA